jgi:Calcineurin-like phosphoesterase
MILPRIQTIPKLPLPQDETTHWSAGRCLVALVVGGFTAVGGVSLKADPDDLGLLREAIPAQGVVGGQLSEAPGGPTQVVGFIGDYGTAWPVAFQVSAMIKSWSPHCIISGGDNNYFHLESDPAAALANQGLTRVTWSRVVGDLYGEYILGRTDARYPDQTGVVQRFFSTVGNHDSGPAGGSGSNGGEISHYLNYFHNNTAGAPGRFPTDRGAVHTNDVSYYAVRRGDVDFFVLDSDAIHLAGLLDPQKVWLAARLAESTARWKVAVFHQAPTTSVRPNANTWMSAANWPVLTQVNAILCAHDHVYERLEYSPGGPPIFLCGNSGYSLYSWSNIRPAESRNRYNATNGALRIEANQSFFAVEAWELSPTAGEPPFLFERSVLAGSVEADGVDEFTFFAEAGQTVTLATEAAAPVAGTPLDPALELLSPMGALVATDDNSGPDGRQALLTQLLNSRGVWRVRVKQQAGSGGYQLTAALTPAVTFATWVAAGLPAAPPEELTAMADPDGDGASNWLEFALGTAPGLATAAGDRISVRSRMDEGTGEVWADVSFPVPTPFPAGVTLLLETSETLGSSTWIPAATRRPLSDWSGPINIRATDVEPGRSLITVSAPLSDATPRRYFRLRAAGVVP